MSTFREWVRQHPDVPADTLARHALHEVPDLLLPVLALAVDHVRRQDLREREADAVEQVLRLVGARRATTVVQGTDGPVRLVLPLEPFALGDGVRVTWLLATRAQHEQRIAMLEAQVRGMNQTIGLHRRVVKLLQERGATRLADLQGQQGQDKARLGGMVSAARSS